MEPVDRGDPYRTCEHHCNHDLARGVTIGELLGGDGPFPPGYLLVSFSAQRAALIEDEPQLQPALFDDGPRETPARQTA
jgi:hypothetical protein